MFSNLIAMIKNMTVITKPSENAPHELLNVIPGAKAFITKEPSVSFAPSKKKSQVTLDLSFISIKNKFTTVGVNCQGVKRQEIVTGVLGLQSYKVTK